jgi:predicted ribonuclease YlaK
MMYRFNEITIKIPMTFFTELDKTPKVHMEAQKAPNAKAILSKKSSIRGTTIPISKYTTDPW